MNEHLTEREVELIRETARAVMSEAGHMCHFDESTRKRIHAANDVMVAEDTDHGTLIVLAQFGKSIQNITKKAITYFIMGLIVIVAAVVFGALIIRT